MSIKLAIENAYKKLESRNWDSIYYLLDLHGTVFKPNYSEHDFDFYPEAINGLIKLCELEETKIILWSSVKQEDKFKYIEQFNKIGIDSKKIIGFNNNPLEKNDTVVGSFTEKPYFSVIIDDKAGFDPITDWEIVHETVTKCHNNIDKDIVIYGGTFDPPTVAHSNIMLQLSNINNTEVHILPSFNTTKNIMFSFSERMHMCNLIAEKISSNIKVLDIEKNNSTGKTLTLLDSHYDKYKKKVTLVIGEDQLESLDTWYNWKDIVLNYKFIVVYRGNTHNENYTWINNVPPPTFIKIPEQYSNVSSTKAREAINNSKGEFHPSLYTYMNPVIVSHILDKKRDSV